MLRPARIPAAIGVALSVLVAVPATADSPSPYPLATRAEVLAISVNCKTQALIRVSQPRHKGRGMVAYSRLASDGGTIYSYRIRKAGVRFYGALGSDNQSFSDKRLTVKRTGPRTGYFRDKLKPGERWAIDQVTFCAK